jgi:hypothetical protein
LATYNRIDRAEFKKLAEQGKTIRELAEHFQVSISAVSKVKDELGLSKRYLRHAAALPWPIAPRHNKLAPTHYVRDISTAVMGHPVPLYRLNTAVRWAQRIVEAGRDLAYDRERGLPEEGSPDQEFCPDGGYYTIEWHGDPAASHLGGLLAGLRARQDELRPRRAPGL